MTLSFTINKQSNVPDPDLDAIKAALAQEVNTIIFIGRLYASQLHDVIQGFLSNTTSAGKVDMFGRIRYPDGTEQWVRDFEVIKIDGPAEQMVSAKTVQFYLDVEDIAISVETNVPVPS
jgi:elongation factor P hydroxylase